MAAPKRCNKDTRTLCEYCETSSGCIGEMRSKASMMFRGMESHQIIYCLRDGVPHCACWECSAGVNKKLA